MSDQDPRGTEQEPKLELGDALEAEFDRMAGEDIEDDEIPEKDDAEEVAEVSEEPTAEAEDDQGEREEPEEPVAEWNEPPPERWPAELKEVYNNLPPQARQAMLEGIYKPMQREYTKTTQELAEMRRNLEPMLQVLQQHQNTFQRFGMDPAQALQHQMAWAAHIANVGPEQGLRDMQAAYGLSPQGQQEASEDEYLTPTERMLKADLDALKQQLGQTSGQQQQWVEQQQQQQQQAYVNAVRNELNAFCTEQKDGKLAHPHIERVAPAVAGIIRGGLIPKTNEYGQPISIYDQMKQAYSMACRLDPSISSASGTDRGQVKRAAAAQRSGVVAKAPAGDTDVPDKDLGSDIEDLYDRLARTG